MRITDRFTAGGKKKEPSGSHVFDRLYEHLGIEHRRIPPRHPQTNGMVERFDGRIGEIVNQTRFGSRAELESTLRNSVKIYNHSIPQRALEHQTPIRALKDWQAKKPELFRKRVYNQAGLDTEWNGSKVRFCLIAISYSGGAPARFFVQPGQATTARQLMRAAGGRSSEQGGRRCRRQPSTKSH